MAKARIFYLRKGVFRTNFSITAPEFPHFPGNVRLRFCEGLRNEGARNVTPGLYFSKIIISPISLQNIIYKYMYRYVGAMSSQQSRSQT